MDIKELENYRLSDAVKFNDTLNPRLWGSDENLLPEVREKLLAIANDFREFLGVPDLRVQDITVSGSNAAYTYTPHSDIDLHLVVDLPEDAVYRELFDAKKYQYNNQHNIKIAGYDVELYVQPAGDTHHSQGIYSVKNSDWISVPQRRRPDVDDISVQSKYEDIGHRIEQAIESGDLAQITTVAKKVKQMRQAGLDQTGEFGPENLAFKALRSNGTLDQMRAALQAAQDRQLSLDEQQRNNTKKKHHYGRVGGMWLPGYEYMTTAPEIANESQDRDQVRDTIKQFARGCFKQYGLKNPPKLRIQHNPAWSERNGTFGRFDPDNNTIELAVTGRHMLDILRTLAHELTHAKQNEQGEIPDDAGRTGSPYEDSANAQAGRMMRHWAEQHPDQFKDTKLEEATGYIPVNSREARDPRYSMALTVDIRPGEVQRQAAKLGWKTDAAGRPPLLMAFQNQLASAKQTSTALTESVEDIVEGATDVLYHMTSTRAAANILADGVFKLASSVGTKAEEKYAPPGRPYFLSTSRSKAGDYSRSVGTSAVMFDLNGQWLAQRYQVKPIDYWERMWIHSPERTSESEDRVFSKDPEISIACVTSVHALIKTADEWRSPYTRQVLLLAKQRGIPAYLYTDPKAWKLQDTRNSVSPQQASALLKGSVPVRKQYKPASSYLEPWLELIHKKAKSELSPKAEKLRYNLVYYGLRYPNEDGGLADDMNNSRKPDSPDYANVDKLIKFMRANRLAKPADLKNALAQKWDAINTKEWDAINTKEQQSAKGQQGVAEGLEQNVPPVLYHATYKPRLKSIQLKGLGAGVERNWTDSKRGVVYLALDPDVAESYAETSDMVPDEWLDSIVILKISTAGLDPNKFHIDSNVQDNQGDTVEYHGVIPSSNISLYKQGVAEGSENNSQDLDDVADWMNTTPDKLSIEVKQEPIEKFIKQIREMYGTYDEFPKDEKRTNRILKLLKRGANPLPIYVEADDPHLFVMEGRHRMVAFWLAEMKTIPVAYVSINDQQGVAEDTGTKLDTDYFMKEGCGIFAVAMALNEPGSQIYIISNKNGESWSKSFPYEITHVFTNIPNKGQFDVHGKRAPEVMANDFNLAKADYSIKGPFEPNEFFAKFMGSSDAKPLYGTIKDVKQVQDQIKDTLDEMALSTYKTMGDFDKPGPFTGADKKLVPHAKNIEKATKFFEQTPYDFRLFFSNIPGTGKYGEYGPMTPDQIRKIFGADAEEIIQGSENAITVVYVGNRGEAKVMLTPWVMAHRLGHAIQAGARGTRTGHVWTAAEKHFFTTVNSTLAEHYGKVDRGPSSYLGRPKAEQANINLTPEYNALFNAIGTQRSSRSGQILRPYEFLYEIFAQYLGTGKITFNPFPANLTYGRKAFGNPTKFMNIKPEYRDEFSRKEAADRLAYDMELMFDSVLAGSVGKILVM